MALPDGKLDDVIDAALASVPVNDCGLSKLAPIQENADRHGKNHVAERDIHSAVADGVIRHFFNEGRQAPLWHLLSPRSNTERFGIAPDKLNEGNPVTSLTCVTLVPFLPSAFFVGRTAEQTPRCARATIGAAA